MILNALNHPPSHASYLEAPAFGMFDIAEYGRIMGFRERVEAYAAAIYKKVEPGTVVLDIGTGNHSASERSSAVMGLVLSVRMVSSPQFA